MGGPRSFTPSRRRLPMRQASQRPDYFLLPTNYETLKQGIYFQIGMNLKAPRGIVWVVLCYVLALVVFTTLEVAGIVALQGLCDICLVVMIIAGVASYRVFKSASSLPSPTGGKTPVESSSKRWYVLSAAFLWMVLAFWLTRGGPWLPRLVGEGSCNHFCCSAHVEETQLKQSGQLAGNPDIGAAPSACKVGFFGMLLRFWEASFRCVVWVTID